MRMLIEIIGRTVLMRCERGATAVEYGLILAMIVLGMMAALTQLGNKTAGMWNNVATQVQAH